MVSCLTCHRPCGEHAGAQGVVYSATPCAVCDVLILTLHETRVAAAGRISQQGIPSGFNLYITVEQDA